MNKTKCPRCGREVPFGRFCSMCGAALSVETNESEGLDAYGFCDRARAMQANMQRTQLVRIQALKLPGDGSLPHMKDIHVEDGMRLFLYSSAQPRPTRLGPGDYTTRDLFQRHGLATSVQPYEDQSWCCFCWVRTQPISTVIALPDPPLLREALTQAATDLPSLMQTVRQAVDRLSLVDRDDQVGGANMQLELCCSDPERFMETIIQDFLEDNRQGLETRGELPVDRRIKPVKVPAPVSEPPRTGWLRTLGRLAKSALGFKEKPKETPVGPPSELVPLKYSLFDLYQCIHMEFRAAIQEGIRQMSAGDLFENRNNIRRQVEEKIQESMSVTLRNYGLAITRVAAFEFICPEFTRRRQKASKVNDAIGDHDVAKKMAAINQETAQLAQDQLISAEERDKLLQLSRMKNQSEIGTDQDRQALAAQGRKQEIDLAGNEFARGQRKADEQLDMTMQHERGLNEVKLAEAKLQAMANVQMSMNQQNYEQLEKFIHLIKELSTEKMQLVIAARDPQLSNMWIASQQHAAQQKMIELQMQHQELVKAAHAQSSQEICDFMKQVAGLVAGVVGKGIAPPRGGDTSVQMTDKSGRKDDSASPQ